MYSEATSSATWLPSVRLKRPEKTALQKAVNIELPGCIWFPNQPQRFGYFQYLMTVQRAGTL
ncbi:hypothetical protein V8E51_006216, partial [Hyaloscypha variabilis]